MDNQRRTHHESLERIVGRKGQRKARAIRTRRESVWYGVGLFGVVGWSVMVPVIIGIVIGTWLDRRLNDQVSWTITFLLIGVVLGCLNAWFWVSQERKQIERGEK